MEKIEKAITQHEEDMSDLNKCLANWDGDRMSSSGSKRYRAIAKRIVLAAQRVEQLIHENTFSR